METQRDPARDFYLEAKARSVFPWAVVREERDGTWWLYRAPGSVGELLSPNVNTAQHPRASFLKARVRLAILTREYRKSATGRGAT